LNMRDEYSGLPAVDNDLIEDEDDEGGLVF
jgi:hypothetical protein